MFERFTEWAPQVVVLAQEEARSLRHNQIGPEHILLCLLRVEEGIAARVLGSLDITLEEVRSQVVAIVGYWEDVTSGQLPFIPRAKKVLELALCEARSLEHDYIGTEHILLGLVRENGGIAAHILIDLDADSEKVRDEVVRVISAPEYGKRSARKSTSASRRQKARPSPRPVAPAPTPASFAQILGRALDQATTQAGARTLDDGDLVLALLEQPDGLISSALPEAGIEAGALRAAIEAAGLRGE